MAKNKQSQVDVQDKEMKGKKISLEDQIIRNFDEVLESDEKIVKGFKPNKVKVFLSRILLTGIPCLFIALLGLFAFLFPDAETSFAASLAVMIVSIALAVLIFACSIWFTCLYFKNTYYAYTNKRIIIRTGIFGVDFKSLDLDNIGASDVYVSLLDKLIKNHTGTLKFGSNSSPINGTNGNYMFAHIEKPYEVYKEIKNFINEVQNKQKKSKKEQK